MADILFKRGTASGFKTLISTNALIDGALYFITSGSESSGSTSVGEICAGQLWTAKSSSTDGIVTSEALLMSNKLTNATFVSNVLTLTDGYGNTTSVTLGDLSSWSTATLKTYIEDTTFSNISVGTPTADAHAATKAYVDSAVGSITDENTTYTLSGTGTNTVTLTGSDGETQSVVVNNTAYATEAGSVSNSFTIQGTAYDGSAAKSVTLTGANVYATGYSIATAEASIATTDTINTALGKLEYKIDQASQELVGAMIMKGEITANTWAIPSDAEVGYSYVVNGATSVLGESVSNGDVVIIVEEDGDLEAIIVNKNIADNVATVGAGLTTGSLVLATGSDSLASMTGTGFVYSASGAATATLEVGKYGLLTGYTKATTSSALSTSDTINTALGKLEYKIDSIVDEDTTYTLSGTGTNTVTLTGSDGETQSVVVNNVANATAATTATTATKLGSDSVGSGVKPIYLSSGVATASTSTAGTSALPVYLNAGTITACSTTLGVSITGNAATATKATSDASGNVITTTYATKTELAAVESALTWGTF